MIVASSRVENSFSADNKEAEERRLHGHKLLRAKTTLVIHFTPRSGSSWLSSLLEGTGRLGTGLELFNPTFMPNIAKHYGARTLDEYIEMARYFSARKGVLSFEITSHQLNAVFKNTSDFFDIYRGCPSYWLIREDIVAQAVSLAKMVRTNVGHATISSRAELKKSDDIFSYDAGEIKRWLKHILVAERQSEKFFEGQGISPLRLAYEKITKMTPNALLSEIANWANLPGLPNEVSIASSHEKIGTSRNVEFAQRFRSDEAEFVKEVESERTEWVAKAVK